MNWRSRVTAIQIGDRVAVSARFLRSTGQNTGDICFCRGTVAALKQLGEITLADIQWELLNGTPPDVPTRMNVTNLSKVTTKGILDRD